MGLPACTGLLCLAKNLQEKTKTKAKPTKQKANERLVGGRGRVDSDLQARGEPPKALSPTLSMESQLVHPFSEAS